MPPILHIPAALSNLLALKQPKVVNFSNPCHNRLILIQRSALALNRISRLELMLCLFCAALAAQAGLNFRHFSKAAQAAERSANPAAQAIAKGSYACNWLARAKASCEMQGAFEAAALFYPPAEAAQAFFEVGFEPGPDFAAEYGQRLALHLRLHDSAAERQKRLAPAAGDADNFLAVCQSEHYPEVAVENLAKIKGIRLPARPAYAPASANPELLRLPRLSKD